MSRELIFERDVLIATRAGGALGANVYRPVAEGTFPVIMTVGPYGKDRHWADRNQEHARDLGGGPFVNWETPDPETWVPKGYVVVRVDNRGTGSSPGFLNPFSRTITTRSNGRRSSRGARARSGCSGSRSTR
jgi:predicted acyl esterase